MGATGAVNYVDKLGISQDDVVQELGWDEDCDSSLSEAIEDHIGELLLDEDTDELCDVVLLWHRAGDDDLVDVLVDAGRTLAMVDASGSSPQARTSPERCTQATSLNLPSLQAFCKPRPTA